MVCVEIVLGDVLAGGAKMFEVPAALMVGTVEVADAVVETP